MKRRLLKALKIVLLAMPVLLVAGVLWGWWTIRRSYPQAEGTVAVAGLSGPVEVVRDKWGVPHIFAGDERDLFFAQGYIHAQDRLWQMHFSRIVGSGRLSSLFGAGPLPADRYLRTIGLRRAAERDLAILSPQTRAALQAYSDGVNAFLRANAGRLPIEFTALGKPEPWTPLDSLTWSRTMSLNLSLNSPLELTRLQLGGKLGQEAVDHLVPPYPKEGPFIVPGPGVPGPPAMPPMVGRAAFRSGFAARLAEFVPALGRPDRIWGSNSWVVHGSRTATGKPLLANDTHLGLAMPSVWYENGLHGGRYDTVGYSLAGLPFVVIGQNRRIAWGVTNLNADVQDVYLERLDDPKNPTKALFQGRWEPLRVEREEIPVRGGEPVALEVRSTRHGPLMHGALPQWQGAPPLSLAWASREGSRLLDAMAALSLARDWPEFHRALSMWDTPSLNFVYADVDGNIAYQSTARVPLRAPGHDGRTPVPGWTGRFEWRGIIPYEEMPNALNPAAGYIVTANHKVVPDDYRHVLTNDWPPPDRARRIHELLAADDRVTMDDMRRFQADTLVRWAGRMRPALLAAKPATDAEREAVALVRSWDLRYEADAAGPTIFQAWLRFALPNTFKDEMGEETMNAAAPLVFGQTDMLADLMSRPRDPWFDDRGTKDRVETRDDISTRSLGEAVKWLSETLGDDPAEWRWGRMHTISFAHQPLGMGGAPPLSWIFNSDSYPVGGDGSAVNAIGGNPDDFRAGFGPSQRYIADLSDLGRSIAVNSTGQVALPFHPHRDDQVRLWVAGEYHPVLPGRDAARAQSESVLTLTPGQSPGR